MKLFVRSIIGLATSLVMSLAHAKSPSPAAPFRVGIAPHTSARFILEKYQPLRLHLERSLGIAVEIVTAPDFTEFARRAMAQDYDLAITTGHQARLLQADAEYSPLVTYLADFKSLVIVAANGKVRRPVDLRNTTVIGLSASSLVTLWGQHWLVRVGCGEVPVRYVSAADSVAQLLLVGEGSAGFVSSANFQSLAPEVQAGLRILAKSPSMAGRVYVLNKRQRPRQHAIAEALWSFAASGEGQNYFEKNNLGGYRKLRHGELEAMDPYADEVRKNLGIR